ncbi:MAG TPA: VOC family protein [Gemmatimonadales bacterium]|jgi:PhnB protein|nr:VOC family protein [Gemmatimonadales bacterium]
MPVKTQPTEYHTLTTCLIVDEAAKAINFYTSVFGAVEKMRFEHQGHIGHAELRIGDSTLMLADATPEMGYRSPTTVGGSPVTLYLYVPDADATFKKAIAAGATERSPVQDQFYGDRSGSFTDPFGHLWTVSTHVKDVSEAEMQAHFKEMMAGAPA